MDRLITAKNFGNNFHWGVAIAAAQNEGATDTNGRSPSIWDAYAKKAGSIKGGGKPSVGCDFYHRYKDDLLLTKALGFTSFRFLYLRTGYCLMAWARLIKKVSFFP